MTSTDTNAKNNSSNTTTGLRIGWGQADITPDKPVVISGQFHARVSEGIMDRISVTALAIDSGEDHVVFLTCDVVGLSDALTNLIREKSSHLKGLDLQKIVISVTHTHTAPETRIPKPGLGIVSNGPGIDLPVMPVMEFLEFMATRAAKAIADAWTSRSPGKVAYGMTHAVIGRNRRWTNIQGGGTMYGDTSKSNFSHIEGYEDPTINVLATYDPTDNLTGVVVNTACPSQVSENIFEISADYWHETRIELRKRHGQKLFILPQCSSAGDLSPHPIWGKASESRMLKLKGRTQRDELANRLANAVDDVLPAIKPTASGDLKLAHRVLKLEIPMNKLTQKDADWASAEADKHMAAYEKEKAEIEANPSLKDKPRWYVSTTMNYRRAMWYGDVIKRFEMGKNNPTYPVTLHVLRLGDMVLSTQPFEYYLDFGIRIKARSPATQTFLLQLAGNGTYCPSERSVAGGGYGSVPASNVVGPEGGQVICEESLKVINELWA